MKIYLKSVMLVLLVLLLSGNIFAQELKSLISFDYYDKDAFEDIYPQKSPPLGEVFTDKQELLVFCQSFIIDGARVVRKEIRKQLQDFSEHMVLVIMGEYSTPDYNITVSDIKTKFSDGTLKVVLNVTRPSRERQPEGTRDMQKGKSKNPFYIYYTDPQKVPVSSVNKVIFYEDTPDGLNFLSQWEKPGE